MQKQWYQYKAEIRFVSEKDGKRESDKTITTEYREKNDFNAIRIAIWAAQEQEVSGFRVINIKIDKKAPEEQGSFYRRFSVINLEPEQAQETHQ